MENGAPKAVVVYTDYSWEHVLCSLRFVEPLRAAGIQLLRREDHPESTSDPDLVDRADLVVIQRDFPRYTRVYNQIVKKARAESKPVIYEIDDLLLEIPKEHPDYPIHYYTPAVLPMLRAAIEADLVTTSTPLLGDYFRLLNPNVMVLPNYLVGRYWTFRDPVKKSVGSPVIIGYVGTTSHLPDLEEVVPALQRILQKYGSSIQIKIWGLNPPEGLKGLSNVYWTELMMRDYEKFSEYFSGLDCDIFIAPLKDTFFNQCKSPIKFLEYSTLGIPGVYQRLAAYTSTVIHGVNGFLASTTDDWVAEISRLVEDQELRERTGRAAQQTVQQNWLLSQHCQDWVEAYQKALHWVRQPDEPHGQDETLHLFERLASQVEDWQEYLQNQINLEKQQTYQNKIQHEEREQALKSQLAERDAQLQEIYRSRVWKLVKKIWELRVRLLSPGK
jgi:glycosyltransferase involved in cell wall biosynthesis